MHDIALVTNRKRDPENAVSRRISEMLCECGASVSSYEMRDEIDTGHEAYISVGGDGTILHLAGRLLEAGAVSPMLGINTGRIGFLTELDADGEMEDYLKRLVSGDFSIENRMVIAAEVYRGGERLLSSEALNDAVLKTSGARTSLFEVRADGHRVFNFLSDGVIVATPTGSTAYSLSAGGAILEPTINAIIVTPVCAHNLMSRPLVFRDETEIVLEYTGKDCEKVALALDGDREFPLLAGDTVEIRKSDKIVKMIKMKNHRFYDIMSRKLC